MCAEPYESCSIRDIVEIRSPSAICLGRAYWALLSLSVRKYAVDVLVDVVSIFVRVACVIWLSKAG